MDTLRGAFGSGDFSGQDPSDDDQDWLPDPDGEEDTMRDYTPEGIGQDERRMQVRAYNHWASLLGERTFPSIEDLEPANLPDFGPHSVLLDFSTGIDDPVVQFLGTKLGEECGAEGPIHRLSDVPPRSLLSRITDHYLQIMANQAPIGFEAEFVNQRGSSILYRGILLPFSSNDETIDFIYGVINWKEMADAETADELLLEIDQALDGGDDVAPVEPVQREADPIADWADSPAHEESDDNVAGFDPVADAEGADADDDLPVPDFGQYGLDDPEDEDEDEGAGYSFASLADYIEAPAKKALDLDAEQFDPADYDVEKISAEQAEEAPEPAPAPMPMLQDMDDRNGADYADDFSAQELPEDADIHTCLAAARELAKSARASEDRSRNALYAAVGRAYDFSLAAKDAPEDYGALVEQSGMSVQERAPMTPVVKLVFGQDYDKTRLTEYAAVLNHAHRLDLERGSLANFLSEAEGGLKGVVNAERKLRREEAGKPAKEEDKVRKALAKKLRKLEAMTFEAIKAEGPEFALVMVRRGSNGVEVIGEIGEDIAMIERAGRKLIG